MPSFLGMPKGVLTLKHVTSMPCRRMSSVASMLSNPPLSKLIALTDAIMQIEFFVAK